MKSTSSLFKGKLLITLTALFTAAMLTASCGYSISDSAMEEGLVPDAVSQFYDNENRIIYTTASAEHRLPVKLDKIPKHVRAAFVSIEDNRFYEHSGIDYRGTFDSNETDKANLIRCGVKIAVDFGWPSAKKEKARKAREQAEQDSI